jgi:pimeloyl-ACP methyl ester carboxylesterase
VSSGRVLVTLDDHQASYVPIGSGEPLVCIPGGPGLSGSLLGDLGGLDRGWMLIRPEWRGAGDSDPPADGRHGVEEYAADLERFREAIGLDRMDLLGHSFGGLVAASYLRLIPTASVV